MAGMLLNTLLLLFDDTTLNTLILFNLRAKLRKNPVLQGKKGIECRFFCQKTFFFALFVCFVNNYAYICREFESNKYINPLILVKLMNKTELIEKIAAGAGITKVDAKKALEAGIAAVKEALIAGDKIALVGFGTFSVSERPAREGLNPQTKEKIAIAAKKVAKFKASSELADALN
jgi:DNA-binding protein HU-beta